MRRLFVTIVGVLFILLPTKAQREFYYLTSQVKDNFTNERIKDVKVYLLNNDSLILDSLRIKTPLTDRQLTENLARAGIRIQALSEYYHDSLGDRHCLVVNYSGIREEDLQKALETLNKIM